MLSEKLPKRERLRFQGKIGAALVEGVVSLCLIIMGTVAAVTLLVNTGMSTYYKEKVGFITNQTAMYAASLPAGEETEASIRPLVQDLMRSMGLPPASRFKLALSNNNLGGKPAVSVKLTVEALPLFGDGQLLPLNISLADAATAMKSVQPEAYLWLNRNPRVSGYLIPVVRVPAAGAASVGLPCIVP